MIGLCPLTGRRAELASFDGALDRAGASAGGVLVLRGEAGVGKTRLLRELADRARARGVLVLAGRAWAMHTRLAYALLVDALGPHLRGLSPADRERLVDDLPELDNLFVELSRRALAPLGDAELEKTRLFEAFCRLVERLSGTQTVVLALDDVQSADLASIEMLHYLCRNVRRARILIALTVRPDKPNAALDDLFHSLLQAGLLTIVDVGSLPDEDGVEMARLLLGGDLAPSLEAIITSRTRGVPMLIEELVRSLLAGGHLRRELNWKADAAAAEHLPSAIRELVHQRLSRLGAVECAILQALAVDGEGTRAVELSLACRVGAAELAPHLERLLREHFVVNTEDADPRYALSHPLIQQTLLDELGAVARRGLHLALVRVLELVGGADLGRLARHYVGAGAQAANPRALEVVCAAAAHARGFHAPAESAALHAAAVQLARSLKRDDALPQLLEELGEARSADGDPNAAAESWSEAARLYEGRGERDRSVALVPRIALARSTRGRNAEALELLRAAALAAPPEVGVRLAEAEVIIRDRMGDIETLDVAVDELRRLAEKLGQPAVAVTAKRVEAWLCASRVECPRAWELLTEALTAARIVGDPLVIFNVLRERFFLAMSLGDTDAVEKNAVEAGELARTQLRSAPLASVAESGRLAADWARGEWRRAAQRVPQIFETALRAGDKRFAIGALYGQAQAAVRLGDGEQARMCLDEAKRQRAEGAFEARLEGQRLVAEGDLMLLEGDCEGAIAALTEACGPLPGRLMRSEFPIHCLQRLGHAYVRAKRPDEARKIARNLDGGGPLAEAFAARLRGLSALIQGGADAVADLERALARFRRLGIARETCDGCIELAELLPATRRDEAIELAREAIELAEKMGDPLTAKGARARVQALCGAAVPPAPARRAARPSADDEAPTLSAREREVAVLITRGLTNDEIARSLHISPHTVATHIKRMYERLGITSRVEVTRYVIDHRLTDD